MQTYQYFCELTDIVESIDGDTTHAGQPVSNLPNLEPGTFFIDHAPATAALPAGPDELCAQVPEGDPAPVLVIGSLQVPVQGFVGHPIRRPH